MGNRFSRIVFAVCALALAAPWASAHRINVFASVAGDRIEGECYSSMGDPVQNAPVRFVAPDGAELGHTRTGDDGTFTFTPTARVDHRVIVETGDGHRATCTVKAEDLPATLSTPAAATMSRNEETRPQTSPRPAAQSDLGEIVSKAVAREVRPIERRIDALQQQWRYRDILGGIGYIFGLAGIVMYLKARRLSARKK